jgi:hypothetical protein
MTTSTLNEHSSIQKPWRDRHSSLLADLAVAAAMAVFIAGMCVALAWLAPFELVLPRPR